MDRLLLDSHTFLWWLNNGKQITESLIETVNEAEQVFVSVATIWELGIKVRKGKLDIDVDMLEGMKDSDFKSLPIRNKHAVEEALLPSIHGDPFDRIMIAQAKVEKLTFVTHDETIWSYPDLQILKV